MPGHSYLNSLAAHGGEAWLQVRLRHDRCVNDPNLRIEPQVPVDPSVALEDWLPPLGHAHTGTCIQPCRVYGAARLAALVRLRPCVDRAAVFFTRPRLADALR